jgi:replicative DNA helicase
MADLDTPQREDVFKRYDIGFQMAILRLCLTEDAFCTKMIGYFGGDKEAEKDLEKFTFFDVNSLHIIFKTIIAAYKQYAKRPTAAQIAQMILQQDDKIKLDKTDRNERTFVDKAEVQKALEKVMNVDISNVEYFKKEMQFFVRQIKAAIATKKITEMQRKQPEAAVKLMQLHVDEMNRITFEEEDLIDLEDVFDMIEESGDSIAQSIPTGIPGLDIDLQGGLPRETLVTILAGTNVGKSMFCGSLGAQCLYANLPNGENAGYKVLHIPLEGMKNETPLRYMACLSGIEYAKIINNALTAEERAKIREVVVKFKDRLIINTGFLGFNTPVEILIAKVDEIFKVFKFDMLIIDYGQLLSSQATNEGHRFTMAFVFRALAAAAR